MTNDVVVGDESSCGCGDKRASAPETESNEPVVKKHKEGEVVSEAPADEPVSSVDSKEEVCTESAVAENAEVSTTIAPAPVSDIDQSSIEKPTDMGSGVPSENADLVQ